MFKSEEFDLKVGEATLLINEIFEDKGILSFPETVSIVNDIQPEYRLRVIQEAYNEASAS